MPMYRLTAKNDEIAVSRMPNSITMPYTVSIMRVSMRVLKLSNSPTTYDTQQASMMMTKTAAMTPHRILERMNGRRINPGVAPTSFMV